MKISAPRRQFLHQTAALAVAPFGISSASEESVRPVPLAPIPSPRQVRWQALEAVAFVHFSINTFTGKEWGYGDESPTRFAPTEFNPDQIVLSAKAGGLRGVILTAKHHDGFCLWPSKLTEHCIRNSPYKGGRGDIVGEFAEACRRHNMLFGLYLSPWDRNHAAYGQPAYIEYFRAQLKELMTNYGPIFEVWFDGANGGDGFYGGARERRNIDGRTYYDWPTTWRMLRQWQPEAIIWGGHGSDARWVGNESGIAGDPCWATMDEGQFDANKNFTGVRNGTVWRPAEADVSIRPGWFWHADEDHEVKTPAELMTIYFKTVGRGANLLLNLAPDQRGRIPDDDLRSLLAWNEARNSTFGQNLALGAKISATSERGPHYNAARVLDGLQDTFWASADDIVHPSLELQLVQAITFDVIRLKEYLPLGQRVTRFAVDVRENESWRECCTASGIGAQRLIRLDKPLTARRIRLRITEAAACPALSEFALFKLAVIVDPPQITSDRSGQVAITSTRSDAAIHYTTDGSQPTIQSPVYHAPFLLKSGGCVKAISVIPGLPTSFAATRFCPATRADWKLLHSTGTGAAGLLDVTQSTPWSSSVPASITLDFGRSVLLRAMTLLPWAELPPGYGLPAGYVCEASADGATWHTVAEGEFGNIAESRANQKMPLKQVQKVRRIRLTLPRAVGQINHLAIADIGIDEQLL